VQLAELRWRVSEPSGLHVECEHHPA